MVTFPVFVEAKAATEIVAFLEHRGAVIPLALLRGKPLGAAAETADGVRPTSENVVGFVNANAAHRSPSLIDRPADES